jgi:RIO kinase 1
LPDPAHAASPAERDDVPAPVLDEETDDYWTELDDAYEEERREQAQAFRQKARPRHDLSKLVEATDTLEGGFETTYKPSRHERTWLLQSLGPFYEQSLINDVLASVKGGKEASVYRCRTHPSALEAVGAPLVAAKVYRPREFRNLRNDKMYREGRPVLTAEGRAVKNTDTRIMRALGKKTEFGMQVQHTSWLMYEFTTLEQLHRSGAAVPKPIAAAENALLMGYEGDEQVAAPALNEVALDQEEATQLFREVKRNIELLLSQDLIHGDLSAYNILYWEGRVTLIDFPQVTNARTNAHAEAIFWRDVTRVCEYFQRLGVRCDAEQVAADLWSRYIG